MGLATNISFLLVSTWTLKHSGQALYHRVIPKSMSLFWWVSLLPFFLSFLWHSLVHKSQCYSSLEQVNSFGPDFPGLGGELGVRAILGQTSLLWVLFLGSSPPSLIHGNAHNFQLPLEMWNLEWNYRLSVQDSVAAVIFFFKEVPLKAFVLKAWSSKLCHWEVVEILRGGARWVFRSLGHAL